MSFTDVGTTNAGIFECSVSSLSPPFKHSLNRKKQSYKYCLFVVLDRFLTPGIF